MRTQTITVEELLTHALERAKRTNDLYPPHAQWLDYCPVCDHRLYVVEYTRVADGKRVQDHSHLSPDGFEVRMDDPGKDGSTEDEVVQCDNCRATFDLSDLVLEG